MKPIFRIAGFSAAAGLYVGAWVLIAVVGVLAIHWLFGGALFMAMALITGAALNRLWEDDRPLVDEYSAPEGVVVPIRADCEDDSDEALALRWNETLRRYGL